MTDLAIGVLGAAGRMGCAVVREVAESDGCVLAAAADVADSPAIGRDAGEVAGAPRADVAISADARAVFDEADVVIEFSLPEATAAHAALAAERGVAHVIGTTGLDEAQEAALKAAGARATIVHAPNMSLPVNILFALTKQVASMLDDRFDIEIVETHHRDKADAPSGTALALGRAAAEGRGVEFDAVSVRGRDGLIGPRRRGDIGLAALRGGDNVGEHTVVLAADGERLELTHRASSRRIYARGAVRAALWARGKDPGLYGMADVLGFTV